MYRKLAVFCLIAGLFFFLASLSDFHSGDVRHDLTIYRTQAVIYLSAVVFMAAGAICAWLYKGDEVRKRRD